MIRTALNKCGYRLRKQPKQPVWTICTPENQIINGINEFENPELGTEEEPVDDGNFKQDLDAAMQEIKEYFSPILGRNHPRL